MRKGTRCGPLPFTRTGVCEFESTHVHTEKFTHTEMHTHSHMHTHAHTERQVHTQRSVHTREELLLAVLREVRASTVVRSSFEQRSKPTFGEKLPRASLKSGRGRGP